uniref:Bcl-2 Bcl-2 homology region 1-3 domain-containing protein n=1 Tax=Cyprinus carpio TaxID=7962 RepID=A0A8C1W3L0_CYPCA
MACKGSRDDLIGEKLLIDMVTSKVKYVTDKVKAILPALPESPLISKGQDQMLVQQLSEVIKVYGDNIDQDKEFNDIIDDLAKVADTSSFLKLVKKVFTDNQITWGRIIVLFYSVGKLSAKMVLIHTHSVVSALLNASLDYFRKHLLEWIWKKGGWVRNIFSLLSQKLEYEKALAIFMLFLYVLNGTDHITSVTHLFVPSDTDEQYPCTGLFLHRDIFWFYKK